MLKYMSKQTIRAVLLDYGGVIADEGFQNGLRAMAREQGIDPDRMMDVARLAVYETGFILGWGTEDEFWAAMREGTGLSGSDEELANRILDGFRLRHWMIERVRQWRAQGYLTVILSDQCHWLDWLEERDHFFAEFDRVFNSFHMGKGKRDPTLFPDIAGQLELAPGEILLVDDIRNNVERARAAGWQAIFYTDRDSFEEALAQFSL